MAVFHLKVSVGSRNGGQSAVAKADYIEREGRYEKDREELEHRESDHMPEWAEEDPRSYWEAADEHERANGSLFREITFALPKELNEGQRRELASGFAAGVTEGERLSYTLAIHRGGGENPHAHLMISERAGDLELAAQLSRKPNVHLGPQALRELPGEPDSFVHQKVERVEKDNQAMVEERDGHIKQLQERIAWLNRGIEAFGKAILEMKDRINNRWRYASAAELARKYSHAKGPQISTKPRSTQPTRGHERAVGPSR